MASDTVLYTYQEPKARTLTDEDRERGIVEPTPAHHPGVPLRDLTAEDMEAMPPWLQDTVAASPLYTATPAGTRHHNAAVRAREPVSETVAPAVEPSKPAPKAEKASDSQ